MKRLFLCIFLLFPALFFGQNVTDYEEIRIWRLVSATTGLRVRVSPELNGQVYHTLPYGHLLYFQLRTRNKVTIDGITDYWYAYNYMGPAWVFGGYLTEYLESEPFAGCWIKEGDRHIVWTFDASSNRSFSIGPIGRTKGYEKTYEYRTFGSNVVDDPAGVDGNYELRENNNMILSFYYCGEKEDFIKRKEVRIQLININKMQLIFDDEVITLIRVKDYFAGL